MASYKELELVELSTSWLVIAANLTVDLLESLVAKTRNQREIDMLRNMWGKDIVSKTGEFNILYTGDLPVSPDDIKKIAKQENIFVFYDADESRLFMRKEDMEPLIQAVQDAYKTGKISLNDVEIANDKNDIKTLKDIYNEIDEIDKKMKSLGYEEYMKETEYIISDFGLTSEQIMDICDKAHIVYEIPKDSDTILVNDIFKESFEAIMLEKGFTEIKGTDLPENMDYEQVFKTLDEYQVGYFVELTGDSENKGLVLHISNKDKSLFNDICLGNEIRQYETINLEYVDVTKEELTHICQQNNIPFQLNKNETEFSVEVKDYDLLREKVFEMIEQEELEKHLTKEQIEDFNDVENELTREWDFNNDNVLEDVGSELEQDLTETIPDENEIFVDEEMESPHKKGQEKKSSDKKKISHKQELYNSTIEKYLEQGLHATQNHESSYDVPNYHKEYDNHTTDTNFDTSVLADNSHSDFSPSFENSGYENDIISLNINNYTKSDSNTYKEIQETYKREISFNDGSRIRIENGYVYTGDKQSPEKDPNIKQYIEAHGGVSQSSYRDTVSYLKQQERAYQQNYLNSTQSNNAYSQSNSSYPQSSNNDYGKKVQEDYKKQLNQISSMNDKLNHSGASLNGSSQPRQYGSSNPYTSILNSMQSEITNAKREYAAQQFGLEQANKARQTGYDISSALYSVKELNREKQYIIESRQNAAFNARMESSRATQTNTGVSWNKYESFSQRLVRTPINIAMHGTAIGDTANSLRQAGTVIAIATGPLVAQAKYNYKINNYSSQFNKYGGKKTFVESMSGKVGTMKRGSKEFSLEALSNKPLSSLTKAELSVYVNYITFFEKKYGKIDPKSDLGKLKEQILGMHRLKGLATSGIFVKNIAAFTAGQCHGIGAYDEMYSMARGFRTGLNFARSFASMSNAVRNHFTIANRQARLQRRMAGMRNKNSKRYQKLQKKNNSLNKKRLRERDKIRLKEHRRTLARTRVTELRAGFNSKADKILTKRIGRPYTSARDGLSRVSDKIGGFRNRIRGGIDAIKGKFNNLKTKLGNTRLGKAFSKVSGAFGKVSGFFGKILEGIAGIKKYIMIGIAIIALVYIVIIGITIIITIFFTFLGEPDDTYDYYKKMHKLETALYDPEAIGLFGDNATLDDLLDKNSAKPICIKYQNKKDTLDGLEKDDLNITGYLRLGRATSASVDDLLVATNEDGELMAGEEWGNLFLYGLDEYDWAGSIVDRSKLYGWYNRKMTNHGNIYYDGIIYTPVKENMLTRTGMTTNILSIISMSAYVFEQDISGATDNSTSGWVKEALNYEDQLPDNWIITTKEEIIEDGDNMTKQESTVIIQYDGSSKPTQEDIDRLLNSQLYNAYYNDSDGKNSDFGILSDSDIEGWFDDNDIDARVDADESWKLSKNEKVTNYLIGMYNLSHQANVSFVTTSLDEVIRSDSSGGANLTQEVDTSKNVEIYKLHESQFVRETVGAETQIQPSGDKLNACDDDGEVIKDKLTHKGILAVIEHEKEYVRKFEESHPPVGTEVTSSACVNDLEALNRLEEFCTSIHYVPPTYEYTYTITVNYTDTWSEQITVEDEVGNEEKENRTFSTDGTYTETVTFESREDELSSSLNSAKSDVVNSISGKGAITTSSVVSNPTGEPVLVKEEFWKCDDPTYPEHYTEKHLYTHCGGHFYINFEIFTSDFSSDASRDLFSIDDRSHLQDDSSMTLAEKYGTNWEFTTQGRNRWRENVGGEDTDIVQMVKVMDGEDIIDQLGLSDKIPRAKAILYRYDNKTLANGEKYRLMLPGRMAGDNKGLISLGDSISQKREGEIFKSIVENDEEIRAQLCRVAVDAIGNIGYYYGGTSGPTPFGSYPSGLDCSGFVSWVYLQFYDEFIKENETLIETYKEMYGTYHLEDFDKNFKRLSTSQFASDTKWFETVSDTSQLKAGDILLKTSGAATSYTSSNHSAIYLGEFENNGASGYWYVQEGGSVDFDNVNIQCCKNIGDIIGPNGKFDTARRFKYFDNLQNAYIESIQGDEIK